MNCAQIVFAAWMASSCAPTLAHQIGCDGKPPPREIRAACCGKADAHQLDPSQVHEMDDGSWVINIPEGDIKLVGKKAEPSPDGCYWVFYNKDIQFQYRTIYCFLVPMGI